ncbi:EmrB/QacA subfamily drug resistance transporter [Kribbella amoyensis]|uniref:EmrB/QacA subfamily drug resistance transporter n=1 Tax=Kribbella amoyensis TaxID=996641 RepID=A0A561BTS9_9ACTN|nr:MFS transporter [Kribbella amoyensis]TWD82294.1 EmrB/QacA subfamily drug resistance transporter [Kribbella amoyensis]
MTTPIDSAARRGIALALILGCQLMMVLDTSIITTALPHVQREFGFSEAGLSWVQNAYVLAFGGLLLLGARAGDLLGRRRVFVAGVALFTLASLGAGLALNAEWLVLARVAQGLAASLAIPSTLALLVANYPDPAGRTRAIALYSAVIGAGGSVGIVIGGVFTDLLSWRWGLLINVPLGIAIVALAFRFLPETERRTGVFDLPGALTSTIGMSSLVFGFIGAAESGWADPVTVVSFVLAAVLLVAFVVVERRAAQPITPLRLFANLERSGAYAGRVLIVGATFSTFYFLSQYLQGVLGLSALATGFAYVPITGMFFAMVYVVRPLLNRLGRPALLIASLVVALAGMTWLTRVDAHSSYFPDVLLPLLVLGVGQGIAIILMTQSGVAGVEADDAGAASGLVNVAHQLGGSLGIAILTIVFTAHTNRAEGFRATFTGAAIFYVIAIALAVAMFLGTRAATRTRPAQPAAVAAK